jgi:hypothetical protein
MALNLTLAHRNARPSPPHLPRQQLINSDEEEEQLSGEELLSLSEKREQVCELALCKKTSTLETHCTDIQCVLQQDKQEEQTNPKRIKIKMRKFVLVNLKNIMQRIQKA